MIEFVAAVSIPIPWPFIILAIVLLVIGAIVKSPAFKGKLGEFAVNLGSRSSCGLTAPSFFRHRPLPRRLETEADLHASESRPSLTSCPHRPTRGMCCPR